MNALTKEQTDALVYACAGAGVEGEVALQLAEELLRNGLLVPRALAYMRTEALSEAEAAERFETRVEVAAV